MAEEKKPVPAAPKSKLDAKMLFGTNDDDFDDFELEDEEEVKEPEESIELPDEKDPAALMLLANDLMSRAIDRRCSDMNVEPDAEHVSIRYLTDKQLVTQSKLPVRVHSELVFCYKVIGGLNINESAKPQDAKTSITISGEEIELRITTIPGDHGETVAITFKYAKP